VCAREREREENRESGCFWHGVGVGMDVGMGADMDVDVGADMDVGVGVDMDVYVRARICVMV